MGSCAKLVAVMTTVGKLSKPKRMMTRADIDASLPLIVDFRSRLVETSLSR
jgi:hypothetical protein